MDSIPGGDACRKYGPPPPPLAHPAPKPQMIHLSSEVVAAKAVFQPKPAYPQLAIIAHVQGTVVLQAIIGKDGTMQDLKVLRGHPCWFERRWMQSRPGAINPLCSIPNRWKC